MYNLYKCIICLKKCIIWKLKCRYGFIFHSNCNPAITTLLLGNHHFWKTSTFLIFCSFFSASCFCIDTYEIVAICICWLSSRWESTRIGDIHTNCLKVYGHLEGVKKAIKVVFVDTYTAQTKKNRGRDKLHR